MSILTGFDALPDYDSALINFAQSVVEEIRTDLKEYEFCSTLGTEDWQKQLPAPLNTLENYPALRSILRYKGTGRFWMVLSAIYGVPFYVFDWRKVLTPEEALVIKNDYPDLINNIDPKLIPGYVLGYSEFRNFIINNISPRVINNIDPDFISNIKPPEGYQNNSYFIYIFFPETLSFYEQTKIGQIRKDIRRLVEYFLPGDREIAEIVNIFP